MLRGLAQYNSEISILLHHRNRKPLVVGLIIVLIGRSVRLYVERDSKLLRNVALVVSVAWTRFVLIGTANVIIHYYNNTSAVVALNDSIFQGFLFTIIVGILIGVASVLLIYIVNRSAKDFFRNAAKIRRTLNLVLFLSKLEETLIEPVMALAMCIVILQVQNPSDMRGSVSCLRDFFL